MTLSISILCYVVSNLDLTVSNVLFGEEENKS